VTVIQVLEELAVALEVADVLESDTESSIDTWDSLGQIAIQTRLSILTNGASDEIQGLAMAESVSEILESLRKFGIVK